MIAPGLSIKAATVWLPQDKKGPEGELSPADFERLGVTELYVAPDDLATPDMAVLAARTTLGKSGVDPNSVGALLHTFSYHQGFDMWSPAHYVAHQAGVIEGHPVNVQQLCNGGAVGVQFAAKWLLATPDTSTVLVTSSDRFRGPGFDRWLTDDDAAYSDSGAAALLGRTGEGDDFLHLRALDMVTDTQWEYQLRGSAEFTSVPLGHGAPIDLRRANKEFREGGAAATMVKLAVPKIHDLIERALSTAGIKAADLSSIALSRLSKNMREGMFKPAVTELVGGSPRFLEHDTGCLGAGDLLANLVAIEESLAPGEYGMLIQGAGGYTQTCAVVQAPVK